MRWRSFALLVGSLAALTAASCDGGTDHPDTGGVTLGQGRCGGVTVVSSDYKSVSVAVLGFDGKVLSKSIVSSASATAGLSAALGSDVVTPVSSTAAPSFVVLDRFPAAVLTWVDAVQGKVTGQLNVSTGFASNPQDYLQLGQDKAYVTRFADNTKAGKEALDQGGDILVIDPATRATVARIDLNGQVSQPGDTPSPTRMARIGDVVYVLCASLSKDSHHRDESVLVAIDSTTDQIVDSLTLSGGIDCTALAVSPDRTRLAVTCSGDEVEHNEFSPARSSLMSIDPHVPLQVTSLVPATTFGDSPLGFTLAFSSNDRVLFTTFGSLEASPARPDRLIESSLDGSDHRVVLEASAPSYPFLGDVLCESSCGACFVADPADGVVQRFALQGDELGEPEAIAIDDGTGLPPVYLGSIAQP